MRLFAFLCVLCGLAAVLASPTAIPATANTPTAPSPAPTPTPAPTPSSSPAPTNVAPAAASEPILPNNQGLPTNLPDPNSQPVQAQPTPPPCEQEPCQRWVQASFKKDCEDCQDESSDEEQDEEGNEPMWKYNLQEDERRRQEEEKEDDERRLELQGKMKVLTKHHEDLAEMEERLRTKLQDMERVQNMASFRISSLQAAMQAVGAMGDVDDLNANSPKEFNSIRVEAGMDMGHHSQQGILAAGQRQFRAIVSRTMNVHKRMMSRRALGAAGTYDASEENDETSDEGSLDDSSEESEEDESDESHEDSGSEEEEEEDSSSSEEEDEDSSGDDESEEEASSSQKSKKKKAASSASS